MCADKPVSVCIAKASSRALPFPFKTQGVARISERMVQPEGPACKTVSQETEATLLHSMLESTYFL